MQYIRYLLIATLILFPGGIFAASLVVSPPSLEIKTGESVDLSFSIQTSGEKVCVVGGMIILNNLSCVESSVVSGVMAQMAPTCANPRFMIGIPGCAVSDKTIFTMKVKGVGSGPASLNFSGVKNIGEGVLLGNSSFGGSYVILAPVVIKPVPSETIVPKPSVRPKPKVKVPDKTATTTTLSSEKTLFDVIIGPAPSSKNNYALPLMVFGGILLVIAMELAAFHYHKKKKHVQ